MSEKRIFSYSWKFAGSDLYTETLAEVYSPDRVESQDTINCISLLSKKVAFRGSL